jgi:hypothetical protein
MGKNLGGGKEVMKYRGAITGPRKGHTSLGATANYRSYPGITNSAANAKSNRATHNPRSEYKSRTWYGKETRFTGIAGDHEKMRPSIPMSSVFSKTS